MTIRLDRAGKRFNRDWIFRHLSASFQQGETIAILGPNGSGKSTLLSLLWSQTPPSEGSINFEHEGMNIAPEEAYALLSIAAPYMELPEDLTLEEQINLHFSFKSSTHPGNHRNLIETLGLEAHRQRPIRNFSSGMKQRLKLGLAFYSDTPVLFLDEPTTNLDHSSAAWYLRLLNDQKNRLIFIATNNPSDYPESSKIINLGDYKQV